MTTNLFFGLWSVNSLTSDFETRFQEGTCHWRHRYAQQPARLLRHCTQHIHHSTVTAAATILIHNPSNTQSYLPLTLPTLHNRIHSSVVLTTAPQSWQSHSHWATVSWQKSNTNYFSYRMDNIHRCYLFVTAVPIMCQGTVNWLAELCRSYSINDLIHFFLIKLVEVTLNIKKIRKWWYDNM